MITVERPVHADPTRLWGFVARVTEWAELLPTVDRVRPVVPGQPTAVGAGYAIKQPGLAELVYEVTEWVPGERFTWVARAPGVRTVATHAVGPAPEGSVLRLTLDWTGPAKPLVALLFTRRTQRYVRLEAETFARLAEMPVG